MVASTQMPLGQCGAALLRERHYAQKPYDFVEWCYERRDLFPAVFTLAIFAMFSPVLIIGLDVARDPSVQYWIGYGTLKCMTWVIVLVIICHIFHLVAARPRFYPMLCSTVIPSLMILLAGIYLMMPTRHVGAMLRSDDCTSFSKKLQVDNAYRSAAQIFDTCVQRVALSTNSTAEATAPLLDVTDCSEFQTAPSDVISEYKEPWAYLQKLEETEGCSGWCTPGEPTIWTRQHYVLDLCSKAAGNVISGKVQRAAMQLLVIGFLEFMASLLMVNTLSNAMRKRGIEW